MKYILYLLSFFLLSTGTFAQEGTITTLEEKGAYYKAVEFVVKKHTLYTEINPDFTASSLTFEAPINIDLSKSYVLLGGLQKFILHKDDHNTQALEDKALRNANQASELYIATQPFRFFSFYSGELEGTIRVNLMYAKPMKLEKGASVKKKSQIDCSEKPASIDQTIWRAGLPDPKGPPAPTTVKHVILHHAAGSNTDTNYINVVRNYYLLHTQTNGWDDIGYNYLVAQDGTIFDGRDGLQYGDDNVIGAHMCARNTNTMGICLLGNYHNNNVFPTDTSLGSMRRLVTWKLLKEHLDPFDSSLHPVASPVGYLGVIAGHRDGCDAGYTECPGDNYYSVIYGGFKQQVADLLALCDPLGIEPGRTASFSVYPNPDRSGQLNIHSTEPILAIELLDAGGRSLLNIKPENRQNDYQIQTSVLANGLYTLKIRDTKTTGYQRIIINH